MPDNRYPKICLLKQISLIEHDGKYSKYNWALQVKRLFFEPIGKASMWDHINYSQLLSQKKNLCDAYEKFCYELDVERYKSSNSLTIYPEIKLQSGEQQYLALKLPLEIVQVIAQIRLLNNICPRIITGSVICNLNKSSFCYVCLKENTFLHMFIDCQNFVDKRIDMNLPLLDNYNLDIFSILEIPNKKLLIKTAALVKHIISVYNSL